MRIFILLLFLLVSGIGLTISSYGCTCVGESTIAGSLQYSDLVVAGKVLNIEETRIADSTWQIGRDSLGQPRYGTFAKQKVTLVVSEKFKGPVRLGDTIIIWTGMGHGDCGFNFKVDSSYVVYGYHEVPNRGKRIPGEFNTDICTRTRSTADQSEVIALRNATRKKKRSKL